MQGKAIQHKRGRLPAEWSAGGILVSFPAVEAAETHRFLDGFFIPGPNPRSPLIVFVHGMGSNFYKSTLKKAFLDVAPALGFAILSFNNRGAERGTEDEKFRTCLADLDAVVLFAKRHGFKQLVLVGHSTGCQKIVFWQAKRRCRMVKGLALLAPADDYNVLRRDLGCWFEAKVAWARKQKTEGRGDRLVPGLYERFTAERFLSVADPRREEANVFRYDGALTQFSRVKTPMMAVFGENEEFAVLNPSKMLDILTQKTKSTGFETRLIPETGHGFKQCEAAVAVTVCDWARELCR